MQLDSGNLLVEHRNALIVNCHVRGSASETTSARHGILLMLRNRLPSVPQSVGDCSPALSRSGQTPAPRYSTRPGSHHRPQLAAASLASHAALRRAEQLRSALCGTLCPSLQQIRHAGIALAATAQHAAERTLELV